jgi:hypothetical protein
VLIVEEVAIEAPAILFPHLDFVHVFREEGHNVISTVP